MGEDGIGSIETQRFDIDDFLKKFFLNCRRKSLSVNTYILHFYTLDFFLAFLKF